MQRIHYLDSVLEFMEPGILALTSYGRSSQTIVGEVGSARMHPVETRAISVQTKNDPPSQYRRLFLHFKPETTNKSFRWKPASSDAELCPTTHDIAFVRTGARRELAQRQNIADRNWNKSHA